MIYFYFLAFLLIMVGLYILITKKDFMKVFEAIIFISSGAVILSASAGYKKNGTEAIYYNALKQGQKLIDPICEEISIIVILLSLSAILVLAALMVKSHYGKKGDKK